MDEQTIHEIVCELATVKLADAGRWRLEARRDGRRLRLRRLGLAKTAGLHAQLGELDRKIAHLMDAIEAGGQVKVLLEQLARRSAERDALKARTAMAAGPSVLTPAQVTDILERLGGLTAALHEATVQERADVYAALGIRMTYDYRSHQLRVTADLARVAARVGGGT